MSLLNLFSKIIGPTFSGELPYPTEAVKLRKGQMLTNFKQIESNAYFLNSGIVEIEILSFQIHKTVDFFFEGEFVCAYTSFLTQHPSDVRVVALTDCIAEVVTYSDLKRAYLNSFEANFVGRILNEHAYLRKAQREKDFLTKTAEERYLDLIRDHPNYIKQIPVHKIAKYLGIHPESLSRIRKNIIS